MKVLTLLIKRKTGNDEQYKYHCKCEKLKLTHLCFADDLLLFCHADAHSVSILKAALDEFRSVFGLIPSFERSLW